MEEQLEKWENIEENTEINIQNVFTQYTEALRIDTNLIRRELHDIYFDVFYSLYEDIDKTRFSKDYKYFSLIHNKIDEFLNNKIDEVEQMYRVDHCYTCFDSFNNYFRGICLYKCGLANETFNCNDDLFYDCIYKQFNYEYDCYVDKLKCYNDYELILIRTEKEINRQKSLPKQTISTEMTQQLLKFKQHILLRLNKRKDELEYYTNCLLSELKTASLINSFCTEQFESLTKENIRDLELIKEADSHLGLTTIDNPTFEYQSKSKLESLQKQHDELSSRKTIPIMSIDEYWINTNYYNKKID
jgi:hypothetical protein